METEDNIGILINPEIWHIPNGTKLILIRYNMGIIGFCDITTLPSQWISKHKIVTSGKISDILPKFALEPLSSLLKESDEFEIGCSFFGFLHDKEGKNLIPINISRIMNDVFIAVFDNNLPTKLSGNLISCDNHHIDLPNISLKLSPKLFFNSASSFSIDYFGVSNNQIVGNSYLTYIHKHDLEYVKEQINKLIESDTPIRCRNRILGAHKLCRWVDSEFTKVTDSSGNLSEILVTIHDIDDLYRQSLATKKATVTLNGLNSLTRHDILNLIMGFLGYLDILKEIVHDDEASILLDKEKQIGNRIQRIMDVTRRYQDIGLEPPMWINVKSFVQKTFSKCEYKSKFNSEIKVDGLYIYADRLFENVISELILNSVTYCPPDFSVSISYELTIEGLILRYKDNGPGILEDKKDRLFLQSKLGQHGIGLYLVKEILDLTNISIRERGSSTGTESGVCIEIIIPDDGYRILLDNDQILN